MPLALGHLVRSFKGPGEFGAAWVRGPWRALKILEKVFLSLRVPQDVLGTKPPTTLRLLEVLGLRKFRL